jgi:hypothetical protein
MGATVRLRTRTVDCRISINEDGEVLIVASPKFPGKKTHIIRASDGDLSRNYFKAVSEVEGLTVLDVIMTALALNVFIPPQIAYNLFGGYEMIARIAQSMDFDEF